ncbi:hypothetical protein BDZ45DRAFT_739769 [Acephala macrosclerotiorum]|nr:hypothetical protein BDZ45DRAFT_739769 [Acephala macrosclerotiorum]
MAESSGHISMSKDKGQFSEVDLTAGQSSQTGANEKASAPPSSPPGYLIGDSYEMRPVPRSTNRFPAPLPTEPPQAHANSESPFDLNFHKPRRDIRNYLFGVILFLVLALVILSTVGGIEFSKLQKQLGDQPKPQNTTLSTTISTTLFSTFSTIESTTLSTTASTTLSTTLYSTESTTLLSLSTFSTTASTTISTTTSITLSSTLVSLQTTTLTPVTSTLVSTQIQSTAILSISTFQTTLPTTTTQLSTVTQTTVSLLPTIQPTAVAVCWKLLSNICSNTTSVPADLTSNGFGDCSSIFRFFYCGLIDHFETIGDMIIPADSSPICGGMKDFCETEVAGVRARGLLNGTSASSNSDSTRLVNRIRFK